MNDTRVTDRNLDSLGWGAVFIWWGLTELITTLPHGTPALGFGLILVGVNVARYMKSLPVSGFTTTVGILAMVWGALDLAGVFLSLPFEVPIFAILLIVLGLIVLGRMFVSGNVQKQEL